MFYYAFITLEYYLAEELLLLIVKVLNFVYIIFIVTRRSIDGAVSNTWGINSLNFDFC